MSPRDLNILQDPASSRPKLSFQNLLIGASLNLFEVSTLGQPFEVLKTSMAANREGLYLSILANNKILSYRYILLFFHEVLF
jgi:hypothetical protein